MKKPIVFALSLAMAPFVNADVRAVYESTDQAMEMHAHYRDDDHFRLAFVAKGSKTPGTYITVNGGKAYMVSGQGNMRFAADFSDRMQTSADCKGRVTFKNLKKSEELGKIKGELFSASVKDKVIEPAMVLSQDEMAAKATRAYFFSLAAMANDGTPKEPDFVSPVVLHACMVASGNPAVLSQDPSSYLAKIGEVDLPKDFYALPASVKVLDTSED